jgi:hypothetical protein
VKRSGNSETVVHGKLEEFRTSKLVRLLQEKVTNLYDQFRVDPHMLPQSRAHLFHKPITSIIAMDKEFISSWISSVKEVVHTREHREKLALEQLKHTLHAFFKKKDTSRNSSKTSIWTVPFSAKYYSNIRPASQHRRTYHTTRPCKRYNVSNQRKRNGKVNAPKSCPMRPLSSYGFLLSSQKHKSRDPLGSAERQEYSGTLVSTAP